MLVIHADSSLKNKRNRTGFKERLFCSSCDNGLLSQIESMTRGIYAEMLSGAKDAIFLGNSFRTIDPKTGESVYRLAISLSLRSGLAKGHFFKKVNLTSQTIARLISELKSPGLNFYVLAIYRSDLASVQAVVEPEIITAYGAKCLFIRFGIWQFFVFLETPNSEDAKRMCIEHNGGWQFIWTFNDSDLELIRELVITNHTRRT